MPLNMQDIITIAAEIDKEKFIEWGMKEHDSFHRKLQRFFLKLSGMPILPREEYLRELKNLANVLYPNNEK